MPEVPLPPLLRRAPSRPRTHPRMSGSARRTELCSGRSVRRAPRRLRRHCARPRRGRRIGGKAAKRTLSCSEWSSVQHNGVVRCCLLRQMGGADLGWGSLFFQMVSRFAIQQNFPERLGTGPATPSIVGSITTTVRHDVMTRASPIGSYWHSMASRTIFSFGRLVSFHKAGDGQCSRP